MKKILFITAYQTGHGHRSISDAVIACLRQDDEVNVREVDGFSLLGHVNEKLSGGYVPLVSRFPRLWERIFDMTDHHAGWMNRLVAFRGRRRFRLLLEEFRPALIVTVHSMFNQSVSRMLERLGKEIPLVTVQADIVTLHASWCNPQADLTICPSEEAYRESLHQGLPEEKLCMIPLPVREQFVSAAAGVPEREYDGTRPLKCLLMLGSEGSGEMVGYVRNLLDGTGLQLTVICGHNPGLQERLDRIREQEAPDRLEVIGFTREVAKVMREQDLLICRSSPNVLFEGITMNLPIIAMATLQGQEKDNDLLVSSNGLGIRSADYPDLKSAVNALTENGGRKYREILEAQRAYRSPGSAQRVADRLLDMLEQAPRG